MVQFYAYGETTYHITHDGRVLSYNGRGAPHELAQYNGKGYRRVRLRGKTFKVHRLVAQAFIPNPHHLPYVIHSDGDRTNNHVSNLMWSDKQSNHGREKGKVKSEKFATAEDEKSKANNPWKV